MLPRSRVGPVLLKVSLTASLLDRAERIATMPKIYPEEFKTTALELLDSGMTQQQVCADLGSPKSILQLWMKNHRRTQHGFEPSETTQDRAEQTRMLKCIRRARAGDQGPARDRGISLAREPDNRPDPPRMMHPLRGRPCRHRSPGGGDLSDAGLLRTGLLHVERHPGHRTEPGRGILAQSRLSNPRR